MSKKDKKARCLAEDFEAVIAMIPKLESLIKTHKEIAEGYQTYRKNGGAEIHGIEKYLGPKEQVIELCEETKEKEKITKTEAPEENAESTKTKRKEN
jgi:hypothetical protein